MQNEIEKHDIVDYEGEEWKVYWKPSNGLVELIEHTKLTSKRNRTAWLADVQLKKKADQ